MAYIDKLRFSSYSEYQDFIKWVICYYPKMLFGIYNIQLTETEWNAWKDNIFDKEKKYYYKVGDIIGYKNGQEINEDIIEVFKYNLRKYYLNIDIKLNDDCLLEEIDDVIENIQLLNDEIVYKDNIELPVANLSWKDDIVLKWRCPIYGIRDYLHKQCGVNPKYDWFYKFWFKGKKHLL